MQKDDPLLSLNASFSKIQSKISNFKKRNKHNIKKNLLSDFWINAFKDKSVKWVIFLQSSLIFKNDITYFIKIIDIVNLLIYILSTEIFCSEWLNFILTSYRDYHLNI